MRDTETRLQELRSKIAGYEDTQQAYQASVFVHSSGTRQPCSPCMIQHQTIMRGTTECAHPRTVVDPSLSCGMSHILLRAMSKHPLCSCSQEEATKWRQRCDALQTKYGSVDLAEHQRVVAECQRLSAAVQVRT